MGMPLNWLLWDTPRKEATSRILRNRLAVTTILAVAPFLNYGRPTYAACVASPSPTFICSDTIAGDAISADNADVSTIAAPPFVVQSDGLYIDGRGLIQFTDYNASSITNNDGRGLSVTSYGDVEGEDGADGAVTIITNGTITGAENGIFAENRGSGDLSITVDGEVTGLNSDGENAPASDGIYARNEGDNLTITTGAQSVVTGDDNAIDARNYGGGDLTISVYGEATSFDFDGIYAKNEGDNLKITIGAQSVVTGAGDGVVALNYGEGDLDVNADGQVTSLNFDGIRAVNEGADLTVTTGAQSVILGDDNGIDARNFGEGDLKITADGVVTGYTNDGIFALNVYGEFQDPETLNNYQGDGRNLIITTGAQSVVRGGGNGIGAYNLGTGYLTIEADGLVGGYSEDGDGIHAFNSDRGGNLTITTGAGSDVFGGKDGIDARNFGSGFLDITANGRVTGKDGDGIYALNVWEFYDPETDTTYFGNGTDLTITTGAASVVTGANFGINARNFGDGNLTITANGQVIGESEDGIYALDGSEGDDLTVITGVNSIVTGHDDGIDARNYGSGFLDITANGQVTGQYGDGIYARNSHNTDDDDDVNLTITTGPGSVVVGESDDGIDARNYGSGDLAITANGTVTGRGEDNSYGSGIDAENNGGGETVIKVGGAGLVQGNYAGIDAFSNDGQDISITNDGLVRNLSGESDDLVITTEGGATHIYNNSTLIGTVLLNIDDPYEDTLDNDGLWNTANGISDFGEGVDAANNTGTLRAADDPTTEEETFLRSLETFGNSGLITLVDGQAGDFLRMDAAGLAPTEYTSEGGRLAVDAVLGPDGISDQLIILGNSLGVTTVTVNVVDATGANFEGIPVVDVIGNTIAGQFVLDGPLNAGFFTWDMRFDENTVQHELYTTGIGGGALVFAPGITGAQDLWHQSMDPLMQRQADLRSLLAGLTVTPVADFAEPVEPTPVANITPGFWLRGVGAYLERDDEKDGFTLDRKQTIWGGLAGFDFGTESAGAAWMFGLFGGYLTSKLEFDETNTEWHYEGPSVGVYATYIDHAFYADATVKVDFLDIEIDPGDLAPEADDADTDAVNIGGLIDTGYKFGHQFFIEPQATLAVVHTEIDDVDIFGGTVQFDDETSIRGRLGLRLGYDHTGSNQVVYSSDVTASVWEEFSGENDISIADPVFGSFGALDDAGGTYGDVSLGFSMVAPEGWSGFIRGNYQFGEDFEAFAGNAGLRYAW